MTNKKASKLSQEQKEEIKAIVTGKDEGVYETLEIVPVVTKGEARFNAIVEALKNGKQYLMKVGYSRNSVYVLLKKLKEKGINAIFGKTQTGVTSENKPVYQFVIMPTKTPEPKKD
jgi:hypothetical protein